MNVERRAVDNERDQKPPDWEGFCLEGVYASASVVEDEPRCLSSDVEPTDRLATVSGSQRPPARSPDPAEANRFHRRISGCAPVIAPGFVGFDPRDRRFPSQLVTIGAQLRELSLPDGS